MIQGSKGRKTAPFLAVAVVGLLAVAADLRGQEGVAELGAACGGTSPELRAWCTEAALALQGARAGLGLALTGGSPVPGEASTLGRRLGRMPRISVAATGDLTRFRTAKIREGGASPSAEETFSTGGGRATLALGILDGFSLLPTVGGVFSFDLVGRAAITSLPVSRGFDGTQLGWGFGGRVGILRESFTLPGVAVSVMRYGGQSVSLSGDAPDAEARIDFDPTVTSIRATAGKEILSVGLLAGIGWDRYGGDATIRARLLPSGTDPLREGEVGAGDFEPSRRVVFGGVSFNFLVLQLSAEGGWASGFDAIEGRSSGGLDPTEGQPFGSISARLTY